MYTESKTLQTLLDMKSLRKSQLMCNLNVLGFALKHTHTSKYQFKVKTIDCLTRKQLNNECL